MSIFQFKIEEMTQSDMGLEMDRYGDWGAPDNIWDEVDTHTCYMGEKCVAFQHGYAAPIAIHLGGEYDQPRWYTPWQLSVFMGDDIKNLYVCEECTVAASDVLTVLGFEEIPCT